MKPRVLLAVADPIRWADHRAALASDVQVVTIANAREALTMLKSQGPFAALVAELRAPGMSGLDLLGAARQHHPDVARLLVVDSEDREAAIVAINEAHVHAFFVHPFSSKVFADAVWQGVVAYQERQHEHEVLAQAAAGIVQLLTGLAHPRIPIPPLSAAAERLRLRARMLALALKLPGVADLEAAALLSRVALAAVPKHILDKLLTHERLAPADLDFLARLPDVGLRLVEHQPRFAGVAEIFRHQGEDPGPMVVRADGVREYKVPLASRILRALIDLQLHENAGLTTPAALAEMRRQSVRYDPNVIKAIELLFVRPEVGANATFEQCMIADLVVGSVLAADALSTDGVPLVSAGTTITSAVLARLKNFADLGQVVEPLYAFRESIEAAIRAAALAEVAAAANGEATASDEPVELDDDAPGDRPSIEENTAEAPV